MRIGFFKAKKISEIFPDCNSPANLKTCWHVSIPALEDAIDSIQIDNKYILSAGHHALHEIMLFSRKFEANYDTILQIENLISYLLDSPCYIAFPQKDKDRKKYFKGLAQCMKLMGIFVYEKYFTLDHYLMEKFNGIASNANDDFTRLFPFISSRLEKDEYASCCLPKNKKLKMAFIVYRQGLLAPDPTGEILNFWRVLEAVTNSKEERIELIKDIGKSHLLPVFCSSFEDVKTKRFNLMANYKRFLVSYVKNLLLEHKDYEALMKFYYKKRRCSSAHAGEDVLTIDKDLPLGSLYKDSILIKYLARFAIERYWLELENTSQNS